MKRTGEAKREKRRQDVADNSAVRHGLPYQSVVATEIPVRPYTLSYEIRNGEEETVKSLNRKLEFILK